MRTPKNEEFGFQQTPAGRNDLTQAWKLQECEYPVITSIITLSLLCYFYLFIYLFTLYL